MNTSYELFFFFINSVKASPLLATQTINSVTTASSSTLWYIHKYSNEITCSEIFCLITGLELSFFSGVYSPSIGFTQAIGESAKQLVGLSGIFIGVGEVSGGVAFGLMGSRITNKIGRDPIVILGFVIHIIAFFLIFLNIPNYANFGDTMDIGRFIFMAAYKVQLN